MKEKAVRGKCSYHTSGARRSTFAYFDSVANTCGHKSVVPFLQQSGSEVATNEGFGGNEKKIIHINECHTCSLLPHAPNENDFRSDAFEKQTNSLNGTHASMLQTNDDLCRNHIHHTGHLTLTECSLEKKLVTRNDIPQNRSLKPGTDEHKTQVSRRVGRTKSEEKRLA